MQISEEQLAIYNFVLESDDSLIIKSTAGSGKTSTILHSIIPALSKKGFSPSSIGIFMFSKPIQLEFKEKALALGITSVVSTFHSYGLQLMKENFRSTVDFDKLKKIGKRIGITKYEIYNLVEKAKTVGVGVVEGFNDAIGTWNWICEEYSFELENFHVEQARQLFKESIADLKTVDFADMIYLPVLMKLKASHIKAALYDEIQDLSNLRLEFVKTVFPGIPIYGVGDQFQSIFGFAGSHEDSMREIKNHFKAKELPLSITWRCSKTVVNHCNKIFPGMRARPGAPEGSVEYIDKNFFDNFDFDTNDTFIICRLNAPLINVLFSLLKRNIKCRIQGKEIGEELIRLTNKHKWNDFAELKTKLKKYLEKQRDKLLPENARAYSTISDKVEVIRLLVNKCIESGRNNKEDFSWFVREIFRDTGDGVVLSTAFKLKGLEAKDVFVWGPDTYKASWIRTEKEKREEKRVRYVTASRAKLNLWYVNLKDNEEDEEKSSYKYKANTKIIDNLPRKGPGTYKKGFKAIPDDSDDMSF